MVGNQLYRTDLSEAAHAAHAKGLTAESSGVLGIRLPDTDMILITPADVDFADIQTGDICAVDLHENVVDVPAGLHPPSLLSLYLKVFKDRRDVHALAHLYPTYASKFAAQGRLFDFPKDPKKRVVRELLKVECRECPSRFTGLCSCRNDLRQSYAGADALLLRENGIITMAADLHAALSMAEFLENAAEKSFRLAN